MRNRRQCWANPILRGRIRAQTQKAHCQALNSVVLPLGFCHLTRLTIRYGVCRNLSPFSTFRISTQGFLAYLIFIRRYGVQYQSTYGIVTLF